jgi:hypothetical protein
MTVSSQTNFSLGSRKMVSVMVLFVGRMMVAAIMMQPSSSYTDHEHDLAFHPNPLAATVVGQKEIGSTGAAAAEESGKGWILRDELDDLLCTAGPVPPPLILPDPAIPSLVIS